MADVNTNTNYYYEQPYEDTTTTTTTTTTTVPVDNSRRRLTIILLVIVALFILIALVSLITNRSNNPGTNNNNTNSNQKITLQFRGVFLEKADIQPLLDDYNKLNPNITIEYANKWPSSTKYSDAEKIYKSELNRLLREGDSVQIPDIFMVNNTWVGDYEEKYAKSSTAYDFDTFKNSFHPVVTDDFAHDGIVHGVPLWIDTLAVLYNKDLLSEKSIQAPPKTWKEFKDIAVSLTKKENGTIKQGGFAAGTINNTSYPFALSNLLLFQNGVEMVNDKGQPSFATYGSSAVNALNFFQGFANGDKSTWSNALKSDAAAFLEGKAAMILATSYRYRDIKKTNDSFNLKVNIGISQVPQITGQSQPVINWADYWGAMVAADRPNSTAAWDFLKWITQPDQLKKLSTTYASNAKTFGLLYPRKDMQQLLQTDPDLQVFNDSLPYARSWYMVNGLDVKDSFNSLLNSTNIDSSSLAKTQNEIQLIIANKGKI